MSEISAVRILEDCLPGHFWDLIWIVIILSSLQPLVQKDLLASSRRRMLRVLAKRRDDGLGAPNRHVRRLDSRHGRLIAGHDLWESAPDPRVREQVVLFNIATAATVRIGIATLYVALFG
jgi:hypothetical protein